MIILCSLKRK